MPDLSNIPTEELIKMHSAPEPSAPNLADIPTEKLISYHRALTEKERPKTEIGDSFIRGAAQGATFGFADEIAGAGKAAYKRITEGGSLPDLYSKYRDEERVKNDAARIDNPKAFIGGNVVGGVATSLIPGVGLAKGAGALANVGKAAALGAGYGAGTSDADLVKAVRSYKDAKEQLGTFGKDVAKGFAIGGVTQGAFQVAGNAASALRPENLTKFANVKTLKAAGAMGGDLKKMGPERVQEVGEQLAAKGIVKPFDSLENIASKAGAAKEEAGDAIGKALSSVDDLVVKSKTMIDQGKIGAGLPQAGKENLKAAVDKNFQFNMNRIGKRIEEELIDPNSKNPLLRSELNKLQTIADDFKSIGSTTLKEGNVVKGTQGRVTNFNSDTVPQAFKKEIYGIIKTELDDVVAKTGNLEAAIAQGEGRTVGSALDTASRNTSVSKAYQDAKKGYGAFKQTEDMATSRLGKQQGNREFGLTDYVAGAAGAVTGGAPAAVVVGGLNKLARQYGDSVMAAGARKAAQIMEAAPLKMGKFAGVLEDAAKQGAPALNATHLSLMKDPNYRAVLENFEKSNAIQRRIQGGIK